jgi:hypothetical protein
MNSIETLSTRARLEKLAFKKTTPFCYLWIKQTLLDARSSCPRALSLNLVPKFCAPRPH